MQKMDTACGCKARNVHFPLKHSTVFGALGDKSSNIELLWTLWISTNGLDNKAIQAFNRQLLPLDSFCGADKWSIIKPSNQGSIICKWNVCRL